ATEDAVEKIGVKRSQEALEQAALLLIVINYAEPLQEEDITLLKMSKKTTAVVVVNKTDLPQKCDLEQVKSIVERAPIITTSLKKQKGMEQLEKAIVDQFFTGKIETEDLTYVTNARHIQLLEKAKANIAEGIAGIQ